MKTRETRGEILKAAQDLISSKGVPESTISEIAAKAGVTDSVIYHHFKSKEDLLFSITGLHMQDVLRLLEEHLEGILEPTSRLSKMVWFHLHYNLTHRDYSRILLFECHSNRKFFQHEAHELIRRYSGIMLGILRDGVDQGVYRKDVHMRVVRDIVLGGLEWETLRCLALEEQESSVSGFRDIVDLICNMIEIRGSALEEPADKKTRIALAAERLFSQKGFRHTSVAEIARSSEVADGTVYEYFKNKEDLLFAIPRLRFREHLESSAEVYEIKTPLRKLRRFIRYHSFLYMTHTDFLRTFLLDILLNPKYYESEAYAVFQQYTDPIDEVIKEGQKDGTIRSSVNVVAFKNLLFGGFCHIALRWLFLNEDREYDRMGEVDEMVNLLERAVRQE